MLILSPLRVEVPVLLGAGSADRQLSSDWSDFQRGRSLTGKESTQPWQSRLASNGQLLQPENLKVTTVRRFAARWAGVSLG